MASAPPVERNAISCVWSSPNGACAYPGDAESTTTAAIHRRTNGRTPFGALSHVIPTYPPVPEPAAPVYDGGASQCHPRSDRGAMATKTRSIAAFAATLVLTPMTLATLAADAGAESRESPTVVSGIDKSGFDESVRPQDDFHMHVNGGWLARTEIPADKTSWGSFTILRDQADAHSREIIE